MKTITAVEEAILARALVKSPCLKVYGNVAKIKSNWV